VPPPAVPRPPCDAEHPQLRLLAALGGASWAWVHAMAAAGAALGSPHPVLVCGEPGTGKLELARALHELGGPAGDCQVHSAALCLVDGPAKWLRRARTLLAGRGTLVLTHLEALDGTAALALAAVLDAHAGKPGRRLVATVTGAATTAGPLLDRLAVHRVELPPLRERDEDAVLLARRLLRRHAGERLRLAPDAAQALRRAPWPGNVRQLDLLVRSVAAGRRAGTLGIADLPADLLGGSNRSLTRLEQLELHAIVSALCRAGGNKQRAAADLGISRATLYRRLRTFHLDLDRAAY
jgi:sigma-54 dependent transcriptional regulator, acetoin dehydrogenase operon transcriptional activator AcoR